MSISSDHYRALTSGQIHGPLACLERGGLRILSVPYGLAIRLRNWSFDRGWKKSIRVGVPVVSVGNLTLGGTGKTPCVEWLAQFFRQRELRVAILSRGYGSAAGRNDEALVLEENLLDVPHLQGADRAALAQTAIEELESELLILDDGFQHRRLGRDLDIVLIDCTNPWGHGWLLPRGWLREPAGGLKRAGVALLTRCDQVSPTERDRIKEIVRRLNPSLLLVESSHSPTALVNARQEAVPVEGLRGRPVIAFCGLGNPGAFRRTLNDLGAHVVGFRGYSDHHNYTREDVEELQSWAAQQDAQTIAVTSQKDLVKLRLDRLGGHDLWAVRIQLRLTHGATELEGRLEGLVPIKRP